MNIANLEETVHENVDTALEQADELLKQASSASEEDAKVLRERAKNLLAHARQNLRTFYAKTSHDGKELACEINESVHDNPWKAVGVAALAGLFVGLLVARK